MSTPPRPDSFVTSRPVAILMVFLAVVVFGYLSYGRLPVSLLPELTYPTLTIRTEYPGAAPEEVENDVSRPIEEALGVVNGLENLSSISRADMSDVILELSWDTEISEATQDVLERLDLVILPEEARRPLILHYDPSLDPVMELSLAGDGPVYEGEAALKGYEEKGPIRGRVIFCGAEGESEPMRTDRLRKKSPTIGVFAPKVIRWPQFAGLIADCRRLFTPARILIRWHPSMLGPSRLSAKQQTPQ